MTEKLHSFVEKLRERDASWVADVVDAPENDAEENDLPAEPKNLDHHPQKKVRLEAHVPDERVAQHD